MVPTNLFQQKIHTYIPADVSYLQRQFAQDVTALVVTPNWEVCVCVYIYVCVCDPPRWRRERAAPPVGNQGEDTPCILNIYIKIVYFLADIWNKGNQQKKGRLLSRTRASCLRINPWLNKIRHKHNFYVSAPGKVLIHKNCVIGIEQALVGLIG